MIEQKKSLDTTNKVLSSLWSIGVAVAVWLIIVIIVFGLKDFKATAPLIGAFAILISAGIASSSVMKSIHTTKINDLEKAEKEKERKRIFALNVMKTIQVTLGTFSKKADDQYKFKIGLRDPNSRIDFDSDIQTTGKLLNSVFCESILPYLNEDEQIIISNFYSEFHRFVATYQKEDIMTTRQLLSSLSKKAQIKLPQYVKMFSNFAQSYIDLNTKHE